MSKNNHLEEEYLNLERATSNIISDEINEKNVENQTKTFAEKVNKTEVLLEKALKDKSMKCLEIDSKICLNISAFSKTISQIVRTENKIFSPKLFAEKIITFINPGIRIVDSESDSETIKSLSVDDFFQLGKKFSHIINDAPIFNYAYGTFKPDINPDALNKQRKIRAKRQDFSTDKSSKPKDFDDNANQDVVAEEIDLLYKIIQDKTNLNGGPICFEEAVTSKNSLTTTVTNIFHTAFMVKERLLKIEADNDKNLVEVVPEDTNDVATDVPRQQKVLRFNKKIFDHWQNNF